MSKYTSLEALAESSSLVEQSYACDLLASALKEAAELGRFCIIYFLSQDEYQIVDLTGKIAYEYDPATDILVYPPH